MAESETSPLVSDFDFSSVVLWLQQDENQLKIQLFVFGIGSLLMWMTVSLCPLCVFGVLLISAVFCLQYRLMNLLLWASIIVLWVHGWRIGDQRGLSVQWG